MIGKLLNSLQYKLDVEEKEWRATNQLRKELEPNLFRKALLRASSKPLFFCGLIFFLVSLLAFFVAVFDPKYWVILYLPQVATTDQVAYFSALWSVQGAIAALVYPIVISFVALLVARRDNAKAPLHIYLHDSAALLAGLSALLLITEMGLQYFGVPYVNREALMTWLIIDDAWFILNIILTINFLSRTFEFIQPARRLEITRQYAVCVAWPREARFHLAQHLFQTAIENNLLPGPGYGSAINDDPSVLPGHPGLISGNPAVTCIHSNKCHLRDIRFRPLAWATKSWLKKAKTARTVDDESGRNGWRPYGPTIAFPAYPFASYEKGETTLCLVTGVTKLSWLERFLIRRSFVFDSSTVGFVELTVNDILRDAGGEAIAALRAGEPESFRESVERMLMLYESILDASQVRDDTGGDANLMTVPDSRHWYAPPIYSIWSRRFTDLFEAATSKLSLGEDYLTILTPLPNRLFSKAQEKATPELLKHFIALSPMLLRHIEDWWVRTVEQQGIIEHSPCNPVRLRPPYYGGHDKVLQEFVGDWELLKNLLIFPTRSNNTDWQAVRQSAYYLEAHLSHTLTTLFGCVLRGDRNGAEWLADVLVKWYEGLQSRLEVNQNCFLYKPQMITIEILSNEWEEVKRCVEIESFGVNSDELAPMAVLAASLKNLRADACCIAIYLLIIWNRNCPCDNSLPAEILPFLINGKALRQGGHSDNEKPYSGVNELLMAILRQYHADGHYRRGYRNRLDNYIEQIANLSRQEMIAGRGYSRWGADDLDSIRDGQLSALLLTVPEQWQLPGDIKAILGEWTRTQNEKVREIERMLHAWKTRLNEKSFGGLKNSHECLRAKMGSGLNFDAAGASLGQLIDKLLATVTEEQHEVLMNTPMSQKRLAEIGQWASSKAFSKETALFPLPLFDKLMELDEPLLERTLVINGMKKVEFTDPPMADRAVNEDEFLAEIVCHHAASSVLADVLNDLKPERIAVDTPESYWVEIKRFADNASAHGLHPLLLSQRQSIHRKWMHNWRYPSREDSAIPPADLVISNDRQQKISGYLWSLNEIPVFEAPIAQSVSILLVRESFEQIAFSRQNDGHFVKAATRDVSDHPDLVDLVLTWQQRISVKKYPAILISHDANKLHGENQTEVT